MSKIISAAVGMLFMAGIILGVANLTGCSTVDVPRQELPQEVERPYRDRDLTRLGSQVCDILDDYGVESGLVAVAAAMYDSGIDQELGAELTIEAIDQVCPEYIYIISRMR